MVLGYHKANKSPLLRTFLSRVDDRHVLTSSGKSQDALGLEVVGAPVNHPHAIASSNPLASIKSGVSNPSVNQPRTGAKRSRASLALPRRHQSCARLFVARSSRDFAPSPRAIAKASA